MLVCSVLSILSLIHIYQNPHGEGFLCDAAYWLPDGPVDPGLLDVSCDGHPGYPVDYGAALLVVENCVSSTPWDADGDGANEIDVYKRQPPGLVVVDKAGDRVHRHRTGAKVLHIDVAEKLRREIIRRSEYTIDCAGIFLNPFGRQRRKLTIIVGQVPYIPVSYTHLVRTFQMA